MRFRIQVIGGKVVARGIDKILGAAVPELKKALNAYLALLHGHIVSKKLSGQVLNVDTGTLRRSFQLHLAKVYSSKIWAALSSNAAYWRIHELGGIIVPKVAQALTIPFPGVKGRARDYENTFIAKGMIFKKEDEERITPLFVLRKSVVMPERPYIRPSIRETQPRLNKLLAKAIENSFKA